MPANWSTLECERNEERVVVVSRLFEAFEREAASEDGAEEICQREMVDTDARPDPLPEARAVALPAALPVARVQQVATCRPPFDEGGHKARMGADVDQATTGRRTRAASVKAPSGSSRSVWVNNETTLSKDWWGNGNAAASAWTSRAPSAPTRSHATRSWSRERSTPTTLQPSSASAGTAMPVPQPRSRHLPGPTSSSRAASPSQWS
jgi:hypothetical protein